MNPKNISEGNDFLRSLLQSFFIIVTLITAAMFFLGKILQPERLFGYEAFFYPFLYGFFSLIPVAIMYSKKELTVKQLLIRKALQLLSIIVLLEILIFDTDVLNMEYLKSSVGVALSIVVIFVLEEAFSWVLNNREAKKLTDELLAYQQNYENAAH